MAHNINLLVGLDNGDVANNINLLVGLDNGDVVHNINPVICFLTKVKWPKF